MAQSSGITSFSAEFSVGSAKSKAIISMSASRKRWQEVLPPLSAEKQVPAHTVTTLTSAHPLSSQTAIFIKTLLAQYVSESVKLYWYCLTHPATLACMVLLGGLMFQYGVSKALAFAIPPTLAFYVVKARLRMFSKLDNLDCRADLVHPSRYYNARKRALFIAVSEKDDKQAAFCPASDDQPSNILGTVAVDMLSAGSTAVVRHLCVHPQYRRQGIGQELLSKAMQFCDKEQFQKVIFSTNNLQGPATKLCRKNGFQPVVETVDMTILPGVDILRTQYVRCLRVRHTSSCCRS